MLHNTSKAQHSTAQPYRSHTRLCKHMASHPSRVPPLSTTSGNRNKGSKSSSKKKTSTPAALDVLCTQTTGSSLHNTTTANVMLSQKLHNRSETTSKSQAQSSQKHATITPDTSTSTHPEASKSKAASPKKSLKLASSAQSSTSKRRSFSGHGTGLLNKMFGSSGGPANTSSNKGSDGDTTMTSPTSPSPGGGSSAAHSIDSAVTDRTSPERKPAAADANAAPASPVTTEKKRRSSVAKAKEIFSSAKQAFKPGESSHMEEGSRTPQTPIQKLSKVDPALGAPQGSHNNSAGESMPGP